MSLFSYSVKILSTEKMISTPGRWKDIVVNLSNAIFKNENEFIILKWIYLKVLLYFGLIKKWNKLNENICWDITSWLMWISYNIIDILYKQFKEQIPVILNPWLTLIMCSWSAVKTTSRWADTSLGFMNINPNPKQC